MKQIISWNEIENFIRELGDHLQPFYGVYGLPRGGLAMAVMISHYYNVPLLGAPSARCLIVDDICDSGETLLHYVKNTSGGGEKKYQIATYAYNPNGLVTPDYYKAEKGTLWMVFPWEMTKED